MEVKINRRTPWKVARAIDLVQKNIDFQTLTKKIALPTEKLNA